MTLPASPIHLEINLDADGFHSGLACLPHSVHRSAYGFIPIPVISIKNGDGPVLLLMAGNHGDEYEGQVALNKLARKLQDRVDDIHGQVIFLPMANFPAAKAGLRTSPIDQGNLNRLFPGNPTGSPTDIIADFIERTLLSRADVLLDIHSGGSSLFYHPIAMIGNSQDERRRQDNLSLLRAIGLPKTILYDTDPSAGYSSSAAARQGATGVTIEIGGGGTITPWALEVIESAMLRGLCHLGILPTTAFPCNESEGTGFYALSGRGSYVFSRYAGLFEPAAEVDQRVETGQLAGWIHHPEDHNRQPHKVFFHQPGIVFCRRVPAQVEVGDCLYETAEEINA